MTMCSPSKKSAEYSGYDAAAWKPGKGANVVLVHSQPLPTRSSTPQALAPDGWLPAGCGSQLEKSKTPYASDGSASPHGCRRAASPNAARWYSASVGSRASRQRANAAASAWLTYTGHAIGNGTSSNIPRQNQRPGVPILSQKSGCSMRSLCTQPQSSPVHQRGSRYPPASTNSMKRPFVTFCRSIANAGTSTAKVGHSLSHSNGTDARSAPSMTWPGGMSIQSSEGAGPSTVGT